VYIGVASMMSFTRIGTPASGPGLAPFFLLLRSLSACLASSKTFGLSCVTTFKLGPDLLIASMRAM
jgi:hypothetical protein